MHLIGELLSHVLGFGYIAASAAAKSFVKKLVCKQLSASAALNDPWLAQRV